MKLNFGILTVASFTACLAGCQTAPPFPEPVPQVALATSRYAEVLKLERPVVAEFSPGEVIALSVYIPRGGGYGVREGTLTVRNTATGKIVRSVKREFREEDHYAFRQDNPGPGTYDVEFSADNGVLATSYFAVR